MKAFISVFVLLLASTCHAVTGGQAVEAGSAPWAAALVDISTPVTQECLDSGGSEAFCQQYCGAVLISPDWALTAAHCAADWRVLRQNMRVLIGDRDLNGNPERIAVAEVYIHPDHPLNQTQTYEADIALLKLASASNSAPASLAGAELLASQEAAAGTLNDALSVFGWGKLQDNTSNYPNLLQRVAMDLRPDDCSEAGFFIPTKMICTAETSAADIEMDDTGDASPRDPDGEGPCEKDSGGPLTILDGGDTPLVAGLVSWGVSTACGDPGSPDVATRVPYFLPWIEETTRANGTALINPAVIINAPASTASDTVALTVDLENRNHPLAGGNPIGGLGYTITWTGGGDLAFVSADPVSLDCVENPANTFTCNYGQLAQQGSVRAEFNLSSLPMDSSGTLTAEAFWQSGHDYQSSSSTDSVSISTATSPELELSLSGLVPETLTDGGRLWIFLTVTNGSGHLPADGVSLGITPPSDHLLQDPAGMNCSATVPTQCGIGTLAAGESRSIGPLEFSSAAALDGRLQIQPSATTGTFVSADIDAEVTYPEPALVSAGTGGKPPGLDGGGTTPMVLLLTLVAGLARRLTALAPRSRSHG